MPDSGEFLTEAVTCVTFFQLTPNYGMGNTCSKDHLIASRWVTGVHELMGTKSASQNQ